jgi:hypothetical protein
MLGASFQKELSIGVVIMGWGISEVEIMVNTVASCGYLCHCAVVVIVLSCYGLDAYSNDCSPKRQVCSSIFESGMLVVLKQGEISALLNLARILGGFGVAYFQVPWAAKHGAFQTFRVEAASAISSHFRSHIFTDNLKTNRIVVGLFFLIIPVLQIKGRYLRVSDA